LRYTGGYDLVQDIITASLDELKTVLTWSTDNEEKDIVLVGGWAVYSYNRWYGSVDIDLVSSRKTRKSLEHFLLMEMGYEPLRDKGGGTVFKPFGGHQKIVIDFANREEHYPFEGRKEELNFDVLEGHTVVREITGELLVTVPERALLLLFKLKAAWDRHYRISNSSSHDPGWETSKLLKDRADILALLDQMAGNIDLDLHFLGGMLKRYDFLTGMLGGIRTDTESHRKYGRMDSNDCQKAIDDLLVLIR